MQLGLAQFAPKRQGLVPALPAGRLEDELSFGLNDSEFADKSDVDDVGEILLIGCE